jgi:SAM-dependent methyltransferase
MIADTIATWTRARPGIKERLREALHSVGYDTTDWMRIVMYRRCFEFVRGLGPERLDALEISAGPQWVREFAFRTYTGTAYPDFDICSETLTERFDLIIADQVFEHLKWPYRAARNVFAMLRPGGHFLITVPFLVRIHKSPLDCTRWSEEGLCYFLQECGFDADAIVTDSWGNRSCLKANLTTWRKRGLFASLVNEPDFPVVVWAFARKLPECAPSLNRFDDHHRKIENASGYLAET